MGLSDEILKFLSESPQPILFAGAGVSAKAGLPTWSDYLAQLAEVIRSSDALTANLMRQTIVENDYLKAASYYFLTNKLREVDKYQHLTEPLVRINVAEVACLGGLPFHAYVTTNYDSVLPNLYAYVHREAPVTYDLGNPGLAAACFRDSFFVARIHGSVDAPQTMVLSDQHYSTLASQPGYLPILRNIFAYRQVLFIGFSFYDPAIRHVLDLLDSELGPLNKGRHLALVPNNISDDFIRRLERLNIKRVPYDPAGHHAQLWDAVCEAAKQTTAGLERAPAKVRQPEPMELARRYLASCYARTQLRNRILPLREIVIEGLIGHLLSITGEQGSTKEELRDAIKTELHLSHSDAESLVDASIKRFQKDRLCQRRKTKEGVVRFTWSDDSGDLQLQDAIQSLVTGALDRFVVREQGHSTQDIRNALTKFFHALILQRGWDLGAAFAARRPPELVEIDQLMWQQGNLLSPNVVQGLIRAVTDLLRLPTAGEGEILANLGRSSFALELAIQAPQDVLLHRAILPHRIYLDANVLLPAITPGHPFFTVYSESITRLVNAAENASMGIQVLALRGFLNEVVNHRRLALQMAEEFRDDILGHLRRHAMAFGTANMNVFLGAYANLLSEQKDLVFDDFLRANAAYENEDQLAEWLADRGIRVFQFAHLNDESSIYGAVYHRLEIAFADELAKGIRRPVLLSHDAAQLTALDADHKRGIRSLFVSADRTLRDHIAASSFTSLTNSMVSHVGLAQLIDLLVGAGEGRSLYALGRLMWSAKVSTDFEVARNYLIDLALSKYDDALAMNMASVVDEVARNIEDLAKAHGLSLSQPTERQRRSVAKLYEGFEEQFFKGMREVIERRRAQGN